MNRKERRRERQLSRRARLHKEPRYTVYLIKTLTPNFYYVGWATNYKQRWTSHRQGTGAQFTKQHGVSECSILCHTNNMNEAEWREKLYAILIKRENPSWVVSMGIPLSWKQIARTLSHFGHTSL